MVNCQKLWVITKIISVHYSLYSENNENICRKSNSDIRENNTGKKYKNREKIRIHFCEHCQKHLRYFQTFKQHVYLMSAFTNDIDPFIQ